MGRKAIDLTGQRFGKWTVLSDSGERNNSKSVLWKCKCDCGNDKNVSGSELRRGKTTNCGCERINDLSGKRFGNLTVLSDSGKRTIGKSVIWKCKCDCGKTSFVEGSSLVQGGSKSCGCSRIRNIKGKRFGRWTVQNLTENRGTNRNTMWNCICDCGNEKTISATSLQTGMSKSCGCLRDDMMRSRVGEKNSSYNPNKTDEERMNNRYQLHGISIRNWRNNIYSRDNYTCQGCGNDTGGNLNAHHLNSWNAFPEERFDTGNGITLCEDCHKEFHHFNGRGNNTLEQFRDHIACTVGEEHLSEIEEVLLSRESEIIGQEQEQPTRELQTT